MDNDPALEIKLWVAQKLRPTGFEDYFFGLDADFCERVDGNWMLLFHFLKRPFLETNLVAVTNL